MSSAMHTTEFRCSSSRAIQSGLQSPNWVMNLLWLSLAVLLQQFVVGTIYMYGYGAEIIQTRAGLPGRSNPDVDANRLGDTFMRGLWPFLVYLLSAMVVGLFTAVPIIIVSFVLMALIAGIGEAALGILFVVLIPLIILANLITVIIVAPLCIRSMICQDFQKSFDLAWLKSFIRLMFKDMVFSSLKLWLLSVLITFAGLLLLCVGVVPAVGLITVAALNLMSQWYELFLIRGGEPVVPGATAIVDATVL